MDSEIDFVFNRKQELLGLPGRKSKKNALAILKDESSFYTLCDWSEEYAREAEEILEIGIDSPDALMCVDIPIPESSDIVVRSSHLKDFIQSNCKLSESSKSAAAAKIIETLKTMIIAMAVDGYGYDPQQKKSPITKEIVRAIEEVGLTRDLDTVRKWLKESAKLLD